MQSAHYQLNYDHELHHWWFTARRRILRDLIWQLVPPSHGHTIIDVGCGTGGNIGSLSPDYTCVGIDPSNEAIRLARYRFPEVRFICGRAPEDAGEEVRRARLFLLTDVLEHVADDFAMLYRLLAAAGRGAFFLITVPADPSLWSPHDEGHGHCRRYDEHRLRRLWQGLPLTELLVTHFNRRLYWPVKLVRSWNRWRRKTSGKAGTDLKMPSPLVNQILRRVFESEARMLKDLLCGRRGSAFAYGVSLLAVLRKESGMIMPRIKPAEITANRCDPQAENCSDPDRLRRTA